MRKDQSVTKKLQESIPALLRENHGVGIIGGHYGPGLPIYLISELAVKMLGYQSSAEFEKATGNSMSALLYENKLTDEQFVALSGSEETHLRQILTNLLSNAVKYNRPHGSITAVAETDAVDEANVTVRFTVSDTGRGISEEFQKEMFEPFTRETSQETTVTGTGLGLPMSSG